MTHHSQITLSVQGMSCASCVGRVERALATLEGVEEIAVNLATETARLTGEDADLAVRAAAALDELGYPAQRTSVTMQISGMSCASCVGRVDKALAAVPGVTDVAVNLAAETAQVTYLEGAATISDILSTARDAGYPAEPVNAATSAGQADRKADEARALARQVVFAALLALPVFVLEMGAHMIPAFHHLIANTIGIQTYWLIQFALTSLVLFGPGRGFFVKGIPALLRGAPDMNSLVAVGTGAAWGYSVVATFLPTALPDGVRAVYFEAAAVIVVLILVGRLLEARAKGRTGAAIRALLGLQVRTARVLKDGNPTDVDVDTLSVGDLVIVRAGERIATDGVVVDGDSHVDESMITGEPVSVAKSIGAAVTGGTVNGNGSLTFRAERVGSDTTLAQIIRMVEQAQGAKLPIQGLVDRITLWFVPAVMTLAALTVVIWLLFGPDPALTLALVAGVSVLIIACPCAMGLATPTSIMVGTGRAAEMGVLFRKGDALQALSEVDVIALDKTGTITMGKPAVTDLVTAEGFDADAVLALVASVEAQSQHPIAEAIVQAAQQRGLSLKPVAEFQSLPGYGVTAKVEGHTILIGADRFLAREGVDTFLLQDQERALAVRGRTALYTAINGQVAALIAVSDPVKPTSRAAINALHQRGFQVAMITGDKAETAAVIAQETGIDQVVAGVLPDGKVAAMDKLAAQHGKVAFVGDGINDAPALAHAHVGIAIGTGTDVAIESADVVLMSGDLRGVVNAVEVSRRTMTNIRQNLAWAFGYNICLVPVAAGLLYPGFGVLLSPVFAASAMALSSVSVLTNALRLRRVTPAMADIKEQTRLTQAHNPQPAE
ncbi:MAG: copper-translocating P-type ATPase [Paracoccaceae bacterium]